MFEMTNAGKDDDQTVFPDGFHNKFDRL